MANATKRTKFVRRNGRGSGGQPPRPNAGRRRPDTLANAKSSYERYIALARDAASAGDVIEAENFYQHAEHYFRTMRAGGSSDQDEDAATGQGLPVA